MVLYIVIDSWFPLNQLLGKYSRGFPYTYEHVCVLVAPDINLINRLALLHIVCFGARSSYYFAWLIGEWLFIRTILNCFVRCAVDSASNAAGLGFAGYNKLGYAEWNLVSGADIFAFEVSHTMERVGT